jgi:hypothetical protein
LIQLLAAFVNSCFESVTVHPKNHRFAMDHGFLVDAVDSVAIRYFGEQNPDDENGRMCDAFVWREIVVLGKSCFQAIPTIMTVACECGSRLVRIEEDCFRLCSLISICIPRSVEFIGKTCFSECHSLRSVTFESESRLTSLPEGCFRNSGPESICIPSSIETIAKWCFRECHALATVAFEPNSRLMQIEEECFTESSLTSIIIPRSVTRLGRARFSGREWLVEVTFETASQWTTIDDLCFAGCPAHLISLPLSVGRTILGHSVVARRVGLEGQNLEVVVRGSLAAEEEEDTPAPEYDPGALKCCFLL